MYSIEAACRTLTAPYDDFLEGQVGCLVPDETEDENFYNLEFVIDKKLKHAEVPRCLLRQATPEEAKQLIDALWDVYDNTNWN